MAAYVTKVRLTQPDGTVIEVGDKVELEDEQAESLLDEGYIEKAGRSKPAADD